MFSLAFGGGRNIVTAGAGVGGAGVGVMEEEEEKTPETLSWTESELEFGQDNYISFSPEQDLMKLNAEQDWDALVLYLRKEDLVVGNNINNNGKKEGGGRGAPAIHARTFLYGQNQAGTGKKWRKVPLQIGNSNSKSSTNRAPLAVQTTASFDQLTFGDGSNDPVQALFQDDLSLANGKMKKLHHSNNGTKPRSFPKLTIDTNLPVVREGEEEETKPRTAYDDMDRIKSRSRSCSSNSTTFSASRASSSTDLKLTKSQTMKALAYLKKVNERRQRLQEERQPEHDEPTATDKRDYRVPPTLRRRRTENNNPCFSMDFDEDDDEEEEDSHDEEDEDRYDDVEYENDHPDPVISPRSKAGGMSDMSNSILMSKQSTATTTPKKKKLLTSLFRQVSPKRHRRQNGSNNNNKMLNKYTTGTTNNYNTKKSSNNNSNVTSRGNYYNNYYDYDDDVEDQLHQGLLAHACGLHERFCNPADNDEQEVIFDCSIADDDFDELEEDGDDMNDDFDDDEDDDSDEDDEDEERDDDGDSADEDDNEEEEEEEEEHCDHSAGEEIMSILSVEVKESDYHLASAMAKGMDKASDNNMRSVMINLMESLRKDRQQKKGKQNQSLEAKNLISAATEEDVGMLSGDVEENNVPEKQTKNRKGHPFSFKTTKPKKNLSLKQKLSDAKKLFHPSTSKIPKTTKKAAAAATTAPVPTIPGTMAMDENPQKTEEEETLVEKAEDSNGKTEQQTINPLFSRSSLRGKLFQRYGRKKPVTPKVMSPTIQEQTTPQTYPGFEVLFPKQKSPPHLKMGPGAELEMNLSRVLSEANSSRGMEEEVFFSDKGASSSPSGVHQIPSQAVQEDTSEPAKIGMQGKFQAQNGLLESPVRPLVIDEPSQDEEPDSKVDRTKELNGQQKLEAEGSMQEKLSAASRAESESLANIAAIEVSFVPKRTNVGRFKKWSKKNTSQTKRTSTPDIDDIHIESSGTEPIEAPQAEPKEKVDSTRLFDDEKVHARIAREQPLCEEEPQSSMPRQSKRFMPGKKTMRKRLGRLFPNKKSPADRPWSKQPFFVKVDSYITEQKSEAEEAEQNHYLQSMPEIVLPGKKSELSALPNGSASQFALATYDTYITYDTRGDNTLLKYSPETPKSTKEWDCAFGGQSHSFDEKPPKSGSTQNGSYSLAGYSGSIPTPRGKVLGNESSPSLAVSGFLNRNSQDIPGKKLKRSTSRDTTSSKSTITRISTTESDGAVEAALQEDDIEPFAAATAENTIPFANFPTTFHEKAVEYSETSGTMPPLPPPPPPPRDPPTHDEAKKKRTKIARIIKRLGHSPPPPPPPPPPVYNREAVRNTYQSPATMHEKMAPPPPPPPSSLPKRRSRERHNRSKNTTSSNSNSSSSTTEQAVQVPWNEFAFSQVDTSSSSVFLSFENESIDNLSRCSSSYSYRNGRYTNTSPNTERNKPSNSCGRRRRHVKPHPPASMSGHWYLGRGQEQEARDDREFSSSYASSMYTRDATIVPLVVSL